MDNFLKLVSNRNSFKSIVKDFYIDELKKFSSNLKVIIEQRKNQEEDSSEKHKQKINFLLSEQCPGVDYLILNPLHYISKSTKN